MAISKKELEKFKERLVQIRNQLTNTLKGTSEEVKKGAKEGNYSQHQADSGTDDFNESVSLELTNQEMRTLHLIDRALEKIEENTYGICDVSGEEIPKARLEAVPYAIMTVKAQEELEKQQNQ